MYECRCSGESLETFFQPEDSNKGNVLTIWVRSCLGVPSPCLTKCQITFVTFRAGKELCSQPNWHHFSLSVKRKGRNICWFRFFFEFSEELLKLQADILRRERGKISFTLLWFYSLVSGACSRKNGTLASSVTRKGLNKNCKKWEDMWHKGTSSDKWYQGKEMVENVSRLERPALLWK